MSNVSENYSHWWSSKDYVTASISLSQGVCITIPNLLLLVTILYHQNLRVLKEYMIISGVASADGLVGIGTSAVAMFNLYGYLTGLAGYPFTAHQCLTYIHIKMIIFGMSAQGCMLAAQSVDRLLSVVFPLQYYSFGSRYVWRVIGVVFSYCAIQSITLTYLSWGDQRLVTKMFCMPKNALSPLSFALWNHVHLASACLAVLLYGVVMVVYRYKSNKVAPTVMSKVRKEDQKKQRRVTVSMSISCLFTFLLFVLPRIINALVLKFVGVAVSFATGVGIVVFLLYNFNPVLNLFIYIKRHTELRLGLIYLFKLKDLPPLHTLGPRVAKRKANR